MKKVYEIESMSSGASMGFFLAETADEALDASARDAGYDDYAAACEATGSPSDAFVATEIELPIELVAAPGGEYAYFADETATWYVVSEGDVLDLAERISRGHEEAYSRWCADTDADEIDMQRPASK